MIGLLFKRLAGCGGVTSDVLREEGTEDGMESLFWK